VSASRVDVVVLHCDQGMGTLVKVYEEVMGEEQLVHLALIDLGSETRTKRYATDALDEVMAALGEMYTPRIDLLVLSHQDTDHWSLLPALKDRITARWGTIEIGSFYRGGARWKERALGVVRSYEKAFNVVADPLPRAHSDYDDPDATPGVLVDLAGAVFRVLAVNTPTSRSADDLVRNGTSAVIALEFGQNFGIFPGDATADTIAFVNKILEEWWKAKRKVPVRPCYIIGAPHHGALRTLASNFTVVGPKLSVAKTFAEAVEPEWVAASAGYESSFFHPFKAVMELLGYRNFHEANSHTYVVWDEENGQWTAVEDTERNLFTTICSLTDPPLRESWEFDLPAVGRPTVRSVTRRGGQPDPEPSPLHAARPH
jgi:beta-lactamase superfamily II metal-dependent hydrolase